MDEPRETVKETYDRIASHFASTREYPWPEVKSFVEDATADSRPTRALDLGCGNGRHVELLRSYADEVVGLDVSRGLLTEATKRAADRGFDAHLVQGDASRLPFDDDSFDLCVYVATLHHLTPRETRVASLDELARVLDADGTALVSAWSTAHDTFDREDGFDTTVDWTLPGGETVPRYYHIYAPDEFDADLDASDLTVVDSRISSGNCYAVVSGQ
ncbi:class I SAM-dependent methyltransferase [Haloferax sp. DFSO60]|uniref:class I SAM-dependent methyltransferase n=1 Tax=Haloferax sp. DFSO60 TaxID=3388652 RepID=UPI00397DDB85